MSSSLRYIDPSNGRVVIKQHVCSPFEIGFLLHCYGRCDEFPYINTYVGQAAITRFVAAELVRPSGARCGFELTNGGKLYVDALMAVPLPVRGWTMPGADDDV